MNKKDIAMNPVNSSSFAPPPPPPSGGQGGGTPGVPSGVLDTLSEEDASAVKETLANLSPEQRAELKDQLDALHETAREEGLSLEEVSTVYLDILSEVKSVEEFNDAKNRVSDKIANCARKIQAKEVPLTELAFNVMTSKAPHEYTKTIPQHIRAALQLQTIREIKRGDIISYVKILNKPGVKPVELAKQSEIDAGKYMEFMQSTLDQITSSMDLDFDSILGKPKQTGLDQFFWN